MFVHFRSLEFARYARRWWQKVHFCFCGRLPGPQTKVEKALLFPLHPHLSHGGSADFVDEVDQVSCWCVSFSSAFVGSFVVFAFLVAFVMVLSPLL